MTESNSASNGISACRLRCFFTTTQTYVSFSLAILQNQISIVRLRHMSDLLYHISNMILTQEPFTHEERIMNKSIYLVQNVNYF